MAKKSMIAKAKRPAKFSSRAYTRCQICGRPKSVYRDFGICRICLRKMDVIVAIECRPLSSKKSFRLKSVLKRGVE